MIKCPKCKSSFEGSWQKTKNGKNWIKDVNGNWHVCNVEKKPELGETAHVEKKLDLRQSGGNLKLQPDGSYLSANFLICKKCIEYCQKNNIETFGRELVHKSTEAVNLHLEQFHHFQKVTKSDCFE